MLEAQPNTEQEQAINILLDWYHTSIPNSEIAVLSGYAGTGKTFTVNHYIQRLKLPKNSVLVAAPTNKAVKVISEMTKLKGKTIHSILGLQPNMDLATFTPLTMKFVRKADLDIDYKLIVIDESSMINKSLYEEIVKRAQENNIKVLFLGDSLQLLPVKENTVSKVFTEPRYKASLKTIVRQGDNNPNTELLVVAVNDILNGTNNLDNYIFNNFQNIAPENLSTSKGFVYTGKVDYSTVEYFNADKQNLYLGDSKYLAYTNDNVMDTARKIRHSVFGIEDYLSVGEQLMGYRAVSMRKGRIQKSLISNSEDYEVVSVDEITIREGIEGFMVTLMNPFTNVECFINIVDARDKESFERYKEILYELYFHAKTVKGRAWIKYYEFINDILCFEDISAFSGGFDEKIKNKDLFYNSGITIHKSQGSTYVNSFINLSNINWKCKMDADKRRLKYVALSRTSNVNIII